MGAVTQKEGGARPIQPIPKLSKSNLPHRRAQGLVKRLEKFE